MRGWAGGSARGDYTEAARVGLSFLQRGAVGDGVGFGEEWDTGSDGVCRGTLEGLYGAGAGFGE